MKKLIIIILLLAFVAVVLGVLGILPEPLQTKANDFAGKLFPAKKELEAKQSQYKDMAEEAGGE